MKNRNVVVKSYTRNKMKVPYRKSRPNHQGGVGLKKCPTCSFSTKHRVLYNRHIKRCNPEKRDDLPQHLFSRHYTCKQCKFETMQSKEALYHQIKVHNQNFNIYPCDMCDYGSKHKCKILRHRNFIHKGAPPIIADDIKEEYSKLENIQHAVSNHAINTSFKGKTEDVVLSDQEETQIDEEYAMNMMGADVDMELDVNGNSPLLKKIGELHGKHRKIKQENIRKDSSTEVNAPEVETDKKSNIDKDHNDDAFQFVVDAQTSFDRPAFKCALCPYTNAQKWKIANHVRSFHMKRKLYRCSFCNFATGRKIEFCIHKTKHTNKKVFSCKECAYKTTMKNNYERHIASHNANLPVKCTLCSYSSTGEAAVNRHMTEYHSGAIEMVEEKEEEMELEESVFDEHEDKSITEQTTTPAKSPVSTPESPRTPDLSDEPVRCPLCGLTLKNETKLRVHMVSHTQASPHFCPLCPLKYKRSSDLNRHMKRKHGMKLKEFNQRFKVTDDEDVLDQDEPLNLSTKKEYPDDQSDSDEVPLDLSVKTEDFHKPESMKCSHCSYLAKWPSDLRRHMLVHSIEKRFKCKLCNRRYKYQFDLNMHIRKSHKLPTTKIRHSNVAMTADGEMMEGQEYVMEDMEMSTDEHQEEADASPSSAKKQLFPAGEYKCIYCPYIGKYKSEVDRHQRLHTGEKPYSCVFCKYRSHWKGDMKRHKQRHHHKELEENNDDMEILLQMSESKGQAEWQEHLEMRKLQSEQNAMDDNESEDRTKAFDMYSFSEENSSLDQALESEYGNVLSDDVTKHSKACKCPHCSFVCEAPSKLKSHIEIHGNLKRYKCGHCGKRSNWTWDVRKHIRKDHPGADLDVITMDEDDARDTLEEYLTNQQQKGMAKNAASKKTKEIEDLEQELRSYKCQNNLPTQVIVPPVYETMFQSSIIVKSPLSQMRRRGADEDGDNEFRPLRKKYKKGSKGLERFRPFQCSKCGRRSNWKWDLNKHIRSSHPSATLVVLSEEEAKSSFPSYLKTLALSVEKAKVENQGKEMTTSTPKNQSSVQDTSKNETKSVPTTPVHSERVETPQSIDENHVKRWKCSLCPYRSNYRSDIGRHAKRIHRKLPWKVIMLDLEEALETLAEYKETFAKKKFVLSPASRSSCSSRSARSVCSSRASSCSSIDDFKSPSSSLEKSMEFEGPQKCIGTVSVNQNPLPKASPKESNQSKNLLAHLVSPSQSVSSKSSIMVSILQPQIKQEPFFAMPKHAAPKPFTPTSAQIEGDTVKDKVWQCPRCPYRHPSRQIMGNHMASGCKTYIFRCTLCGDSSKYRSSTYRHMRKKHHRADFSKTVSKDVLFAGAKSADGQNMTKPYLVFANKTDEIAFKRHQSPVKSSLPENPPDSPDGRSLQCNLCPFVTTKTGLLKIHKTYHKPQRGNKFKCKYCPYYVSATRLLNQHMKLHLSAQGTKSMQIKDSITTSKGHEDVSIVTRRDMQGKKNYHVCERCPFVTKSKKDAIYHKQFHRPKSTATFKCDHCDYWVSMRRLLTQHLKVHTASYLAQHHGIGTITEVEGESRLLSSPTKSDLSDLSSCDAVEIAKLKQQIIDSKIVSVPISPDKLKPNPFEINDPTIMKGYIINEKGELLSGGVYKKIYKCSKCPYATVRSTNLQLHEKMHGVREGENMVKCQFCDYHTDNKSLMSHHLKVHSVQYRPGQDDIVDVEIQENKKVDSDEEKERATGADDQEESSKAQRTFLEHEYRLIPKPQVHMSGEVNADKLPKNTNFYVKYDCSSGNHILERAKVKRYNCEKCPYATMKKSQFEHHFTLHGSKQKCVCDYCDYSVPAYHLLLQHRKLHLMPNPNLLSMQSISNLQHLPEMPADVAAAVNYPLEGPNKVSKDHDSMELYENSQEFTEPKKLYKCDKCPYTNVRRNHLLEHLKCHLTRGDLQCPHCDYSVSKVHLLNQHIKIHFNVSEKIENVVHEAVKANKSRTTKPPTKQPQGPQPEYIDISELCSKDIPLDLNKNQSIRKSGNPINNRYVSKSAMQDVPPDTVWICQYCDRAFNTSEKLLRHEMQHLVGTQA